MITIEVRWQDQKLGKVIGNAHTIHPDAVPMHMGELADYARATFDRVFAELEQAHGLARARAGSVPAFPVRFPACARGVGFVPMALMERHAARVHKSYGCTVADLAARGGVSYQEIVEVLEDWPPGSLAATFEEAAAAVRQAVRLFEEGHRNVRAPGSHLRVVQ